MGLFSKKGKHLESGPSWPGAAAGDERYPGAAGYSGIGLKKNAMPENRFKFVRPDGKDDD
jgi:hypothetical protein